MFFKIVFAALALAGILWAVGVDFGAAKDRVTGASTENAQTMAGTAGESDWGS